MTPRRPAPQEPEPPHRQMVYLPLELHEWVRDVSAAARRRRPRGAHPLTQSALMTEAVSRLRAELGSPARAAATLVPD